MIKRPSQAELFKVLPLATAFADAAGAECSNIHLMGVLNYMNENHLVLVDEEFTGFIAANSYVWMLDPSIKVACELAWWVNPEARGQGIAKQLVEGYEAWAREIGCKHIEMSALAKTDSDDLSRFYNKIGFNMIQRTFRKEV